MKILRGGLQKFLDIRKGGSEKIRGGLLKFQASSFNIFIPLLSY